MLGMNELLVKKFKQSLTFSPKTRGVLVSDAREFSGRYLRAPYSRDTVSAKGVGGNGLHTFDG